MNAAERFLDTSVLLYLLSGDAKRADRAEAEVAAGGVVSVQVLNEFVAVAARKLRMPAGDIREVVGAIRASCECIPVTLEAHDLALDLMEGHRLPIYDAMIVASARLAGCRHLVTEDLNHGQRFGELMVRNPFR